MDIEVVDPRLREATLKIPTPNASNAFARKAIRLATKVMPVPKTEGVAVTTIRTGRHRARLYRPVRRATDAALLWVHGGGLLFGDARQDEALCGGTAAGLGMTIVSANYRFAPEHPYPAPLDDVHEAWTWVQAHAGELHVDPARIAIGGESAGGGLAAALALRLHDEGGTQPVAQWLFSPMIDDRTAADASLDAIDHWVWSNAANRVGWSGYLGERHPGDADVPAHAAAARRADVSGLPPAYLAVGDIELFLAEDEQYARRLGAAGVPTTLDVVPGAPHGFENWARSTAPAVELLARAREWLGEATV